MNAKVEDNVSQHAIFKEDLCRLRIWLSENSCEKWAFFYFPYTI